MVPKPIAFLLNNLTPIILSVGVPIALLNLRTIARNQKLTAINRFNDELDETADDRRYIFQEFPLQDDYGSLERKQYQHAMRVINLFNKTAYLMEKKILPAEAVLTLSHTVIIRSWYVLERFVKYHESRIGGRYGRRVERLAKRARRYHDIRPLQRSAIRLDRGEKTLSVVVYETRLQRGVRGWLQRTGWCFRNMMKLY